MTHSYDEIDYANIVKTWNYEEFSFLTKIKEPRTKFARGYKYENGEFYLEPWFYTQLTRLFERFPDYQDKIIKYMLLLTQKNSFVMFTQDILNPVIKDPKYLLVEIDEIIHHFDLPVDDNSRGSDYGD
ncbi:MAG TPA: hypothetical protein VFD05_01445 [Bacilli bacterium]|nr:hypothetical protein [Bacilli bacterium]